MKVPEALIVTDRDQTGFRFVAPLSSPARNTKHFSVFLTSRVPFSHARAVSRDAKGSFPDQQHCRVRAADNEEEECVHPHVRSPLVVSPHSHLAALIRTHNVNHSPLQLIS